MSDEREIKSGNRNADQTGADEEVKLHVKGGGTNMDAAPGANDDDDDNDVEAHVKGGGAS
jgi:hypothetical protein